MIEEKEISLSSIFQVIWERGKRISLFTVLCMAVAAGSSLLIPNRYLSDATLFVLKSKLGERTMQNPAIPMRSFEWLFTADEILLQVIDRCGLRNPPYKMKYPGHLRSRMVVSYINDTSIIKIAVMLEDAEKAAEVANVLAQIAIEKNKELIEKEKQSSSSQIETEIEKIRKQVTLFREEYERTAKKNLKPFTVVQLTNLNTIYSTLEQQIDTLDHSIVEQKERLARMDQIFSATDSALKPKIRTERSVFSDNLSFETMRQTLGENVDLENLKGITFYDEAVNPSYFSLQQEYEKLKADLPSLEAKRQSMANRIKDVSQQIEVMQNKLFDMELDEMIKKAELDRALEIYSGIDKQASWAGTTVTTERQDLVLWIKAVPNLKKVYPTRSIMVAVAGMMAFLLAFLFYLLVDLYGLMKERNV
ncbi:MAG: Wzz/FepE/Etk N-terminal domain-containing protein [bacterium]